MKILLFAMPESEDFLEFACKLPNLAILSLAGSLPNHDVRVLDLILAKPNVKKTVIATLQEQKPDLVGLSAMTFSFHTLLKIAKLVRQYCPKAKIVAGGYHTTLMYKEISEDKKTNLDFIIRGEGEITIQDLVFQLEQPVPDFSLIQGLSYLKDESWHHNEPRPLIDIQDLPLPDRNSRLQDSFHALGMPFDVIETSRGCPNNCKFCSIIHMYGRSYRPFPQKRIIKDLIAIQKKGTKAVFIIDDNITHSIDHFKEVCKLIIDNSLNDMCYMTQVTAAGMANNPDLVALMEEANFKIIFVGFESMNPERLRDMKKPTSPKINLEAARLLRKHNMAIIAGTIVGFPEDDRQSIKKQLKQVRGLLPDAIYVQYLTPYPKTKLREELIEADLVENLDDYSQYNGFNCVVRTKHLSRDELYRAKKLECLKPYFNLKMIVNNFFLRNMAIPMIVNELKTIKMLFFNIFTLKQRKEKIDI